MKQLFTTFSILIFLYASVACGNDEPDIDIPQTGTETNTGNDDSQQNNEENTMTENLIKLYVAEKTVLNATLEDNSSTKALMELLEKGDITINMSDYGNMEKVGYLPHSLPRNDEYIVTEPGDIILYSGNQFVIYYDTNRWSLTRLGKINGTSAEELKKILGNGDITVTISTK